MPAVLLKPYPSILPLFPLKHCQPFLESTWFKIQSKNHSKHCKLCASRHTSSTAMKISLSDVQCKRFFVDRLSVCGLHVNQARQYNMEGSYFKLKLTDQHPSYYCHTLDLFYMYYSHWGDYLLRFLSFITLILLLNKLMLGLGKQS